MSLVSRIASILQRRALTLAAAESCTGGLLSSLITDVPGSSAYFKGGIVSYADGAKEALLGVPKGLIAARGAVSEEVALAMARGARRLFGADIALAITGIAGPTGATATKPVGLVYVALAAEGLEDCREFHWQGTRRQNKRQSAEAALSFLDDYLTAAPLRYPGMPGNKPTSTETTEHNELCRPTG